MPTDDHKSRFFYATADDRLLGPTSPASGVLDFSNPGDAEEIAYADPASLSETQLISGGAWSTYWYDGLIYECDITRGLMTWNWSDPAVAGARELGALNPQTQELTLR